MRRHPDFIDNWYWDLFDEEFPELAETIPGDVADRSLNKPSSH